MGEKALGHEVIGLNNVLDVRSVDAHCNTHEHVLRPLSRDTIDLQQVRAFEGFKTETGRGLITEGEAIEGKTYKL